MGIDLYYLPGSAPCRAVQLAAKSIGVELNLKLLDLMKGEQLTPEFLALNPQHTIPTLVDNGFSLWESRAILTYLQNAYGKDDSLYPKDPKKRGLVDQRLYFDLGTLYARFSEFFYPQIFAKVPADEEKKKKLDEALQFLDGFLSKSDYAAGNNLTLADFSLVATVSTLDAVDYDLSSFKNVTRWYAKVKSTAPGYEETNGKGVEAFKQFVASLKNKK